MSSTDNRIVKMQFDNAQFRKGAADTQKSLADLSKATDAAGKSRGLLDMSAQMGTVSVSASKMAIATTAALGTIVAKATTTALSLAKALTFDPIKAGFHEYEELLTKQNVIMNATGKSAKEVKKYLSELNTYSDKTIYSFSNMTASITKFVNAGISLPQSVKSIKGIANSAAFAGATTEEANRAMVAFSQSMSTGYIMLNDWMQIENANMATMGFKDQLIKAGVEAGTLTKRGKEYITTSGKAITATKGWREGLQEQWATTEVMNNALGKYTDKSTKLGREATKAATQVRTFTAFMDTLKESLGSGWATIFTSLFGNLEQATAMWTGLSGAIGGVISSFFDFIGTALVTWRTMGGFEKTVQGFKNLLAPFAALLGAIGKAWGKAFPGSNKGAGKALYGLSAGFEAVTRPLQWLADLISGTTPLLTLFFRAIHLGGTIIGRVIDLVSTFVGGLLGIADLKLPSTGGFVDFVKDLAKEISNAIKKMDAFIQKGGSIGDAFRSISMPDLSIPGMKVPDFSGLKLPSMPSISNLFSGGGDQAGQIMLMSSSVGGLKDSMFDLKDASAAVGKTTMFKSETMTSAGESIKTLGGNAKDTASSVANSGDEIKSVWQNVTDFVGSFVGTIAGFIKSISVDDIVSSFNMAVFATMGVQIARFMNGLTKAFQGFSGIGPGISSVLEGTGSALKSFQTQARAKLILNIAIALGILAVAMFILSTIPADKLATALAGLAGVVVLMSGTMWAMGKIIEKMDGKGVNLKMIALSIAMAALGFAMMELAIAMKIMDSVDTDGVVKGLVTMVVVMSLMQGLGAMGKLAAKNMIAGAAAIIIVSGAMMVLAAALLMFKLIDWEDMGKAGAALGVLTVAVGALALIPYAGIAKVGVALLAAAFGVESMARAMILFGFVEWESVGKAAVTLLMLTAALAILMVVGNPIAVSGMVGLSLALIGFAAALMVLNNVEWSSLGKLAVLLGILVVAMLALTGVLYLMAPVVIVLVAFAAAILVLGVALFAFAAALTLAMALAAGGAAAFAALATGAAVAIAVFMQTLAHEAPVMKKAFLKILEELIDTMVQAVPMIIQGIKDLWTAVKKEFTSPDKKKATGDAGKSWIESMVDGIKEKMPKIVKMGAELIVSFLTSLKNNAADIAAAGVELIAQVIVGIGRKIGKVTEAAVDLIVKFAKGISDGIPKILKAGIDLIATFLHDLADAIRYGSAAIGAGLTDVIDAMKEVGVNMVQGIIDGVGEMLGDALGAIGDLASGMVNKAKSILDIFSPSKVFRDIGKFLVMGLTLGIQNHAASAIKSVASMISGQIAISELLIDGFIQRLEQRVIAAQAKAEGLAAAANQAQKAADQTKNKKDDRAADALSKDAKQAGRDATAAEKRANAQKAEVSREKRWDNADALERAKIRANDASTQLIAAKNAEKDAASKRIQADALDKQAKARGVTEKQSNKFEKKADALRVDARDDAKRANKLVVKAKTDAAQAMKWQKVAGREAAKDYDQQFNAEAKAASDAEAFEKLNSAEQAKSKREEAIALQAKAEVNLKSAKKLAYTDVVKANKLATLAREQAEQARALVNEAKELEASSARDVADAIDSEFGSGPGSGSGPISDPGGVFDLTPSDAAALAFNQYSDLYDAAYAAAAAQGTVEFNQYNTSPESLDAATIYRQTNNLVTYSADKLAPAAA